MEWDCQPLELFCFAQSSQGCKDAKEIRNKKLKIRNKEMQLKLFEIPNIERIEYIEPFEHFYWFRAKLAREQRRKGVETQTKSHKGEMLTAFF